MPTMTYKPPEETRPLKDFWLRYKKQQWGICTGVIRATSLEKAEELGRKYCADDPRIVFLTVEDPILVSESI